MFFLIQNDKIGTDNVQNAIVLEVLRQYKYDHGFEYFSTEDFYKEVPSKEMFMSTRVLKTKDDFDEKYHNAIPFGTVRFIEQYLQIFKGIERDNAIEVPRILRTDEFLKRKYSIVRRECIPREGYCFLKDATQQKIFSCKGNLEYCLSDEMFQEKTSEHDSSIRLDATHLFQVSEVVNVLSEYRVYVLNKEINSVCIFAGNPLLFPDAELIQKAVDLINMQEDSPASYSLDLMVTPKGTAITEVHNFLGVGLYTVDWDEELLYAYKQGMDYVQKHNVEQTEYSNY